MKLTKVAFAVASVLAVAAGSAYAGQIDSSSATLAREVIYSDAQVVRAPSKSYTFAGVIDARTNEQRLQLQWTLGSGLQWAGGDVATLSATAETNLPVNAAGVASQGVIRMLGKDQNGLTIGFTETGLTAAVANTSSALSGATVKAFVANGGTTLVFNITIPANAGNYIKDAVFQINAQDFSGAAATPANVGVTNALTVAKVPTCVGPDTAAGINFKHFTNHNGNTTLMTGDILSNPDSEHLRVGSTNDGRYMNFTENLKFTLTSAGVQSQTDAATLRSTFLRTANDVAAIGVNPDTYVNAAAVLTAGNATKLHRIGKALDLVKVAAGLDLDYMTQYGAGITASPAAGAFSLNDPAVLVDGTVEAPHLVIKVSSPLGAAGWAPHSTVALLTSADANIAGQVVTGPDANGVATITLSATADYALFAALSGAKLYYVVSGALADGIPQNATFDVTATLQKSLTGTKREQDNTCKASMAGVGGGIKIDVRNYATYATFGATGPSTVVRIINNSESQTADIYGQMIYADGTYGAWGKLGSLVPREVMNMANKDIEALLVNQPSVTNPFGSGTVYTQKAGLVAGGTKAGISDRLRIVSNTGSTLRVQSYMVVGSSVIDTSNAQGVDFENSGSRVPVNAIDAQPVSQDAINGLSKQ